MLKIGLFSRKWSSDHILYTHYSFLKLFSHVYCWLGL